MTRRRHFYWHLQGLLVWADGDGNEDRYPKCFRAIRDLQAAVTNEHGPQASRSLARRSATGASRGNSRRPDSSASRTAIWRAKNRIKELTSELDTFKFSKTVHGSLSEAWILRVILASPNVSGRALAESFHKLVGSDRNMISRESVKRIRSAFLEMWKNLIFATVRDFIAVQLRSDPKAVQRRSTQRAATGASSATGASPNVVCVHVAHVQDEAELRLLSNDPNNRADLPRRSRSSKVQLHVVTVRCLKKSWDIPVELEGLVDKSAATLATSFERLMNTLLGKMLPQPQPAYESEVWLAHIIIGDAINTNEAAAKILWALAAKGSFGSVRYFLLLGKCGTHQSALSAKDGVIGRAAATAAEAAGEGKEFEDVVGNAVRIFKYLVPEYYEDFKTSVAAWVHLNVECVPPQAASPATGGTPAVHQPLSQSHAARMQMLYTKHVICDELVELWHSSSIAEKLQTVAKDGQNHEEIKNAWIRFLLIYVLLVDNNPTLSRFFSFRGSFDRMLTMALLNFPATGGLSTKPSAREVGQKRVRRVRHWFSKPAAGQVLRRGSLVLQLTSVMEAFMSKNPNETEVPILVAIQQGKADNLLNDKLQHLLGVLHYDPDLNIAGATAALLATAADVRARLDEYKKYPYRFVCMCRKWFPATHTPAVTSFLQTRAADLDVGFSLQLQKLALAQVGEMEQRGFLLSDVVQDFMEDAAIAFCSHSLAAERAAAEVKRREGRNIALLGNVSLDLLCRRINARRSADEKLIEEAAETLRKLKHSSWHTIAWEQHELYPDGVRSTVDAPIRPPRPATGGHRRLEGSSHARFPLAANSRSRSPAGLLSDTIKEMCNAELQKRIHAAAVTFEIRKAPTSIIPCTRMQMGSWLGLNIDVMRTKMQKDAAPKRRAAINNRVDKRSGLPTPADRIQPVIYKQPVATEWGKLLQWRNGWHLLDEFIAAEDLPQSEEARRMYLLFVVRHKWTTYVMDLEECRTTEGIFPYHVKGDFKLNESMVPLCEFELLFRQHAVRTVFSCQVEGKAATGVVAATGDGGVFLKPVRRMLITTATGYRTNTRKGAKHVDPGQLPTEEGDSCEDLGVTNLGSDLDERDPAVDTGAVSLEESGLSDNTTGDESASSTGSVPALKKARPKKVVPKVSATCDTVPAVSATCDTVPAKVGKKGKRASSGKSGPRIFDNGYFYIKDNQTDLKMIIIDQWLVAPPVGIGRLHKMSKTITPYTVGEAREFPVRTMVLLKTWMLWRARQIPGWIEREDARQRLFTEEADLVFAEIKRLQPQEDGLLGNFEASEMLLSFVPDILAKL